jgi:hypothetical protein
MGYQYIPRAEAEQKRGRLSNVLFPDVMREFFIFPSPSVTVENDPIFRAFYRCGNTRLGFSSCQRIDGRQQNI